MKKILSILIFLSISGGLQAQTWQKIQEIDNPIPNDYGTYGANLKLHNGQLFVSAMDSVSNDVYDKFDAKLLVYEKNSQNLWQLLQTITKPDSSPSWSFGQSFAVDSNYLVISDPYKTNKTRVYKKDSFTRKWKEYQILDVGENYMPRNLGISLAIKGDLMLVGTSYVKDKNLEKNVQGVFYFNLVGESWVLKNLIVGDSNAIGFGHSVAIGKNVLAIGAPYSSYDNGKYGLQKNAGLVYPYIIEKDNKLRKDYVMASHSLTIIENDFYGYAIGFSGNDLIVGAPGAHRNKSSIHNQFVGQVHLHGYQEFNSRFGGTTTLSPENEEDTLLFGVSVDVEDEYVLIGSHSVYDRRITSNFKAFDEAIKAKIHLAKKDEDNRLKIVHDFDGQGQISLYNKVHYASISGNDVVIANPSKNLSDSNRVFELAGEITYYNTTCLPQFKSRTVYKCGPYYSPIDGSYQSKSNTFVYLKRGNGGCDTTIKDFYYIDKVVSTHQNPRYLEYQHAGELQWLDCDSNYKRIPDETGSKFYFTKIGRYAVEVTNFCVDTSHCIRVYELVNVEELSSKNYSIYPNPNNGLVQIQFKELKKDLRVHIYSSKGVLIEELKPQDSDHLELEINGKPGLYFLEIIDEEGNMIREKVLKQ